MQYGPPSPLLSPWPAPTLTRLAGTNTTPTLPTFNPEVRGREQAIDMGDLSFTADVHSRGRIVRRPAGLWPLFAAARRDF